jgi:hypothetical protein
MEMFRGRAHIPGVSSEWTIMLELDWKGRQCSVHAEGIPGHITTWQGLVVQTFDIFEIAFKTKGIAPVGTHWWHLVRDNDDLSGIVVGLPGASGIWSTCSISLHKVELA